jgi:hypothetical protein
MTWIHDRVLTWVHLKTTQVFQRCSPQNPDPGHPKKKIISYFGGRWKQGQYPGQIMFY